MADIKQEPDLEGQDKPAEKASAWKSLSARLSGRKSQIGVGLGGVALMAFGIIWYTTRDEGPGPHEQLQRALQLLDDRDNINARQEAREIAEQLRELDYRSPEFAGGIEFTLGIAAFRDAEGSEEAGRDQQYLIAANELRKAESLALIDSRRPEWAFALGSSLYELGKPTEARPLLEEAVEKFSAGRIDTSTRLVDIYLDLKTPDSLEKALSLNTNVIKTSGLQQIQYDAAYLRRAQILLSLDRNAEAEAALKNVSEDTQGNQGTIVFRAQTLMAEERYQEAIRILEPVARSAGLEQTFARQASYLMGVCAEAIDDFDAAINHFERTADKYEQSHEGLAASLRAADLLRQAGRNEEALNKRYRRALQMVPSPENFRNRWITLKQFRQRVEKAWNEWVDQHAYQEAISLSKMMVPLFQQVQAYELAAIANERWAHHLEDQLASATFSQRKPLESSLRERWRVSAQAYSDLAFELRTSAKYSDVLRISAEHYRLGHDFENALIQWTRFIDTRPKQHLPVALVRRGEVLMDLDRLDEALEEFQRVIETFSTNNASFEAAYIVGKCHLERNEPELAEKAWRNILTSELLTPNAKVWQLALFSLGRLLFQTAAMKKSQADRPSKDVTAEQSQKLLEEAFVRWDESVRRLEEFLLRDTTDPQVIAKRIEARYLLAMALQLSSELPRRKLETAETENARLELRRTMQALLAQARDEFRRLQADLMQREEVDRLDKLGQRLLRNCFFEIAHTYYLLAGYSIGPGSENYDKAIVAYGSAANKYPRDPQVLLAYLQMANCYDRLGKPADARSMLEQAKVILKQMPDDVFASPTTNWTKQQWQEWIEWAQQLQQSAETALETAS